MDESLDGDAGSLPHGKRRVTNVNIEREASPLPRCSGVPCFIGCAIGSACVAL